MRIDDVHIRIVRQIPTGMGNSGELGFDPLPPATVEKNGKRTRLSQWSGSIKKQELVFDRTGQPPTNLTKDIAASFGGNLFHKDLNGTKTDPLAVGGTYESIRLKGWLTRTQGGKSVPITGTNRFVELTAPLKPGDPVQFQILPSVPLPASLSVLLAGLAALAGVRWRPRYAGNAVRPMQNSLDPEAVPAQPASVATGDSLSRRLWAWGILLFRPEMSRPDRQEMAT